ncbi:MAG TPA: ubiquinol-cytochrome C chaperone family protein, partial [Caulobacter sp.]|nr:ubiquinol-cytochrome C chaperone family protein [Caulobacter sp.]
MLGRLFGRQDDAGVATLYKALVDQARRPEFYSDHAVPDTLDGRFDMILLHAFVVLHRFRGEAAEAKDFAQRLFDRMFADMDRNLREIGVGDLSVGHKVKAMGRAFYGRAESYQAGLADPAALAEALRRNLEGRGTVIERAVTTSVGEAALHTYGGMAAMSSLTPDKAYDLDLMKRLLRNEIT